MEQTEHGQNRSRNRVQKRESRTSGLGETVVGLEKQIETDRANRLGAMGVTETEDEDRETKHEPTERVKWATQSTAEIAELQGE